MTGYVIGADGGNSKTDLVVAGVDGEVLARVAGPGTRPYVDGFDTTVTNLVELVGTGVAAAGQGGAKADVASFYLANVDFVDEEQAMFAALTAARFAVRVEVRNDTLAVLQGGSSRGWGIAVVSGAGINAAGVYPDGRDERFLGIGEMSGDWGGGRAVSVAALGAAVRAGDGRGRATALSNAIRSTFGSGPDEVAIAAQRGDISERALLGFAPVVFAVAAAGDTVAVGIVERLASEVLDFVRALLDRMHLEETEVDVVLGGGTLQGGHAVLLDRLTAGLAAFAPLATLRVLDLPPVAGAVASALALAGAGADAIERARSSLRSTSSGAP